jgi:hypothetical protein
MMMMMLILKGTMMIMVMMMIIIVITVRSRVGGLTTPIETVNPHGFGRLTGPILVHFIQKWNENIIGGGGQDELTIPLLLFWIIIED